MSRHDQTAAPRTFFCAPTGKNTFDAKTSQRPGQGMQNTIDKTLLLEPELGVQDTAQVICPDGGIFTEGFVAYDFVQINAENSNFVLDAPVGITVGSFQLIRTSGVSNSRPGGITWLIDGKSQNGIRTLFTGSFGAGSTAAKITGNCQGIFYVSDQIQVGGVGSIGIDITADSTDVIEVQSSVILLQANDQVAVNYNPPSATTRCTLRLSAIEKADGVTGTTGIVAQNGILIIIQQGILDASVSIHVKDGGIVRLSADNVLGDVTVDEGGTIIASVGIFSGNVVNNGLIIPDDQRKTLLLGSSFSLQPPLPDTLALDIPHQIEFGGAQNGATDPVELAVDGSITINQTGQYFVSLLLQYGRTGAGQASWLFFRVLIDGAQFGNSIFAKLDNENSDVPVQFTGVLDVVKGNVVTVEFLRDSQGINSGSLMSESPTLGSFNPAPSASIRFSRTFPLEV